MSQRQTDRPRSSAVIIYKYLKTYVQILMNPEAGVLKVFKKTWFLSELVLNLKKLEKNMKMSISEFV